MKTPRISILLTTIVTSFLFLSVFYVSCKKEEKSDPSVDTACINVDCNNGKCYQGDCACYPGYEGFFCDIKSVSRYLGTWNVVEKITHSNDFSRVGQAQTYTFTIMPVDTSVLQFRLAGLMGFPEDTILCKLGNPVDLSFHNNKFYFHQSSLKINNVYIETGKGSILSSGSIIDTMIYTRAFEPDTTFFEETVFINAQKI